MVLSCVQSFLDSKLCNSRKQTAFLVVSMPKPRINDSYSCLHV